MSAAVYQRLAADESAPWSPGDVLSFTIPSTIPWCDLQKSRIELTVQPTATADTAGGVACLTTPAGAAGFVRSIQILTKTGQPLELIQNYATLAMVMQSASCGTETSAYRGFAYGEQRSEIFDWLNRSTTGGVASTIKTRRIYLDLSMLCGVFKWSTWPNAAVGGLVIQITLNDAESVFKRFDLGGSPISCADLTGGAANLSVTTVNDVDQGVHPLIDAERDVMDQHFEVGDDVVFVYTAGGNLTAQVQTLTAADYLPANSRMTLTFGTALPDCTGVSVFRHISDGELTCEALTGTYVDTIYTSLDSCPFFINQEIQMIVQMGGAGAYQNFKRLVANLTIVGGVVRITFNAALAQADAVGFIRGVSAPEISYSVVDARFRLKTTTPPAAALERIAKEGLKMDIVCVASAALQVAANSTVVNWQLPVANYMSRALAFVIAPVHTGGTARFDTRTRPVRSAFTNYRFVCDGQSDPPLPISLALARPPFHDSNIQRTMQQLSAATDGTTGALRVLYPGRENIAFMKSLNFGGLPRSISGMNCEFVAQAGALPALQLFLYTFHLRTLSISANSVEFM
jgi:hypothetical protein